MIQESGRSLIEIMGGVAISAILLMSTIKTYNSIRKNQILSLSLMKLEEISKNIKYLKSKDEGYANISLDYLIKSGALKNALPPVGKYWNIKNENDFQNYSINISGLTKSECEYLKLKKFDWTVSVSINGYTDIKNVSCISGIDNNISFIVD